MTPAYKQKDRNNLEVIRVNGSTYVRELFGRDAMKAVKELDSTGKFINVMQTTLMRKTEGKRFYI